ncbi:MAG: transglutaminaseTgpA domain-containing protein [Faecousia sp.]
MKYEKWLTLLCGTLLAFLLSFSCAFCIATGFDLHADGLVNLRAILLWCVFVSLLCSIFDTFRFGSMVIFVLLALLGVYLSFYGALAESVEALCETISTRYHNGYQWTILRWSEADLQTVDRTMALQLIGSAVAMVAAWTVCKKRLTVWAVLAGLLPLLSCTILTTTVPAKEALFLWLSAMALLLLTQAVRRRDVGQGNRLTLFAALPVALALALLFHFVPQEGYTGDARANRLLEKVQAVIDINGGTTIIDTADNVDLTKVGWTTQRPTPVMEVTVTDSGTYYLRGRAYDVYTGKEWRDSGTESALTWPIGGTYRGAVTIKTKEEERFLYLPYYTNSMLEQIIGNSLQNESKETEYSFDCYYPLDMSLISWRPSPEEAEMQKMTALPGETQEWAAAKADEILAGRNALTEDEKARFLCRYVQNHARYNLNTPRMDSDYSDFAQWFLTEADSGYCIHYATATTVLLRAVGIPARYVTGFTVEGVAGQTVTVPMKNAHAWVEYWTDACGWQILDPTPAAQEDAPEQTTTEPTTLSQTEATQEATAPPKTTASESAEANLPNDKTPDEVGTSEASKSMDFSAFLQTFRWLIYTALMIALVVGQWKLRVFLRRRARHRGTTNARALRCWRQALCYARVLGEKPESALRELALKAKFSQYVLTEEELQQFERYFRHAVNALRKKPLPLRLIYRLVLALY